MTTTVTAAGSMALAIEAAENTLLASESFAARILAADPAAAVAERVYYDSIAEDTGMATMRPFALLKYAQRASNVISEGIQIDLMVGGGLLLLLEDNVSEEFKTHNDVYMDFVNWIGSTIDEMELLSGDDEYLPFRSELVFAPRRTKRAGRQTDRDFMTAAFLLTYGDEL